MNFNLIDTHAHLNLPDFEKDWWETAEECLRQGIGIINVGINYETSLRAVEQAENFSFGLWTAIGLHPLEKEETDNWERYCRLARSSSKVVAVGEIGLDYWRLPKDSAEILNIKQRQKEILGRQLDLAEKLKKPVIIHCRSAFPDLIKVFQERKNSHLRGVIHCFTGSWEEAKFFLQMGFYLGFDGIIFKANLGEVIQKIPLEKILVETDCPYLTPPMKKEERNSPLNLKFIVEKIATLRKMTFDEVAQATTTNAQTLFNLYESQ